MQDVVFDLAERNFVAGCSKDESFDSDQEID
jgi:hypothetical protein